MGKKFNQGLLNEEIKRFKRLYEYTFYTEDNIDNDEDLILGSNGLHEDGEDDSKTNGTPDNASVPPADGEAASQPTPEGGEEDADNLFDIGDEDMGGDLSTEAPPTADGAAQEPPMADIPQEDTSDDVEVDVTQIVKGSEEAKQSADSASQKSDQILKKFNDLERRVASMSTISNKIEQLEKEIVKRNPTPIEKLEMRSLNSYPYSVKLTDYWKDIDGYQAEPEETKKPEYILRKSDIDGSYTDSGIKNSFSVPDEYEEEEI
jgi:hypothetical protein